MANIDEFINAQLAARLAPGERIIHTGVLSTKSPARMAVGGMLALMGSGYFFAALCERRLLLIHTRRGALGVQTNNEGVTEIVFADVQSIVVDRKALQRRITITLHTGATVAYYAISMISGPSGQGTFADALHATYQAARSAPPPITAAPEVQPASSAPASQSDALTQLEELAALHRAGVLSTEEYNAVSSALLKQI